MPKALENEHKSCKIASHLMRDKSSGMASCPGTPVPQEQGGYDAI